MRKVLSMLLLALFVLLIFSPLLTLARAETGLPACCRRNGQHHCQMGAAERAALQGSDGLRVAVPVSRCPFARALVELWSPVPSMVLVELEAALVVPSSHPLGIAQTQAKQRSSEIRSRQQRGPPCAIPYA